MRRKKHRGKKRIDAPMSIGKIERQFEKMLEESQSFGSKSNAPTLNTRVSCIYGGNQELTTRLPGCFEFNSK
jgi:hypothetical protein